MMDVERRGLVLSQLAESMWDGKELSGDERAEMDCGAASEAEGHLLVQPQ